MTKDSKKREITFHYYTILTSMLKVIGTDLNGAGLLYQIYRKSYNHTNTSGWCYASKEDIAANLNVSRPTVFRMLSDFEKRGYLERHPETGHIRTTDKYNRLLEASNLSEKLKENTPPSQNETTRINPPAPSQSDTSDSIKMRPEQSQNDTPDSIKMRPNNKSYNKIYNKSDSNKKESERKKDNPSPIGSALPLINEFQDSLKDEKEGFQLVEIKGGKRSKKKAGEYKSEAKEFYYLPEKAKEGHRLSVSWKAFEQLWNIYPSGKRGSKPDAWAAWHNIVRAESREELQERKGDIEEIGRHILKSKQSPQWKEGFVPHMATYLNQERWQDEVLLDEPERKKGKKVAEPTKVKDLEELKRKNREAVKKIGGTDKNIEYV